MLEQILMHLNNWFVLPDGIYSGKYSIKDGSIALPFLVSGQYYRIFGSVFNDGLHQVPIGGPVDETFTRELIDEEFTGTIWALAIPRQVIKIADEIKTWADKNQPSAYTSESFSGYSYSKATGQNGTPAGWQDVFAAQLAPYRKIWETAPVRGQQPVRPYYRPFNPDYPWRW